MKLFKNFKTRKQLKRENESLKFLLTGKDATINSLQRSLEYYATCDVVRLKTNYRLVDLHSITDKEGVIESVHRMLFEELSESIKDYIVITENRNGNVGPYGEIVEYVAELDVIKR